MLHMLYFNGAFDTQVYFWLGSRWHEKNTTLRHPSVITYP